MTHRNILNKRIVSSLNRLIGICVDGERGFRLAAEREADASLRSVFRRYADQRAEFRHELESQVTRLGGLAITEGNPVSEVRRVWAAAKANVSGNSAPLVAECEREEDVAKRSYEQTLDHIGLPVSVQRLVESQYVKVKETHDRVRVLRAEKQEVLETRS